jgi:hypothetical protein
LYRWQQQRDQNTNDRNDHQKFDKRKTTVLSQVPST